MASIRHVGSKALGLPLLAPGSSGANAPPRFYERFGDNGHVLDSSWPRMTTEESERQFEPRRDGLRVLFVNAPIRERPYPTILPTGPSYATAVGARDGPTVAG